MRPDVHIDAHVIGDLISYQKDGKRCVTIAGELEKA
jgi:hypothetical protein